MTGNLIRSRFVWVLFLGFALSVRPTARNSVLAYCQSRFVPSSLTTEMIVLSAYMQSHGIWMFWTHLTAMIDIGWTTDLTLGLIMA